jgi:hypothetical protein
MHWADDGDTMSRTEIDRMSVLHNLADGGIKVADPPSIEEVNFGPILPRALVRLSPERSALKIWQ